MSYQISQGYVDAANRVLEAVRSFKKAHPGANPTFRDTGRAAVLGTLTGVGKLLATNPDAHALIEHIAAAEPDATWLMLCMCLKREYSS